MVCFSILFFGKVNGQLTAQFTADVVSGCAPIRVVFTDQSLGNVTDWRWDLGNGTIALKTKSPSTTYLLPGTYTVKLTVYNGLTDSATITKTNYITVNATPIVNFSGLPLTGCLPLKVQFKDSSIIGGGGSTNYQWDFGDGNISSAQNPVHNYNSAGIYKVTLTARSGSGCLSSLSKLNYVRVFDSVRARFGFSAPPTCALPVTYTFTDSSVGAITQRIWDFGDGGTSLQKNPSHTYTAQGNYRVRLIVINGNGCVDTLVKNLVVSSGSVAANFSASNGCVGKAVSFTNTSTPINLVDSVRWSFGNGKTSVAANPTTVYNAMGSFNVKLVAWFGKCVDSTQKTIDIQTGPDAKFSGAPRANCKPPLTVNFTNQTSGGTVVRWSFGNGTTSTAESPTVTYNAYGRYTVTLVVRNASGCLDTLVQPDYVVIENPASATINGLPYRDCMPYTNTFSVNTGLSIVDYQWDFGDGTTSNLRNPRHTFTDTTNYQVSVVITTADGCSDTIRGSVHGGLRPKAEFSGAPNLICPLDPVVFTNLSSVHANSWFWDFGDGGTSTEQHPTYLYRDTGFMKVTLIAYNNGCSDTLEIPDYVYVNPPIARFEDTAYCSNPYEVFFTDNSVGGNYWKWYINEQDSIESKDIKYVFPDTGLYNVRLFIRDSLCEHDVQKVIQVLDEKAAFIATDSGFCGSSFKRFEVTGPRTHPANIVKYRWDFGNGKTQTTTSPVVTHQYTQKGVVDVRLVITEINGCMDTAIIPVNVKLYGPQPNFSPALSRICAGSMVSFEDSTVFEAASPIVKWRWNFGNGTDTVFTGGPFSAVYEKPGTYDVKLVVEDSGGCRDSITRKNAVVVYKPAANFSSPDTSICINSPAGFVNMSTGVNISSFWDFGNGKTRTASAPSIAYDSAGRYDVQLIVTDSLNCRDTLVKPQYIFVGDAVADFAVSDTFTTCPPILVSFTNNSVNNVQNQWWFGNGNTSSLESPSHTYNSPGVFNATLVVTGHGGCQDSLSKAITIKGPYGSFNYSPLGGCPPLTVNFQTQAFNTKSITYDYSDGQSILTTDSLVSHLYNLPGEYIPKVILSDDLGCKLALQGPDTITIIGAKAYIRSLPVYNFCDGATVSFFDSTVTADVIESFKWNFGDGTQSTMQNPVHTYTREGNYMITLEVVTRSGCISSDTLDQNVTITRTPRMDIGADSVACVPAAVQFRPNWINRDTAVLTYNWNFGNGTSAAVFNPLVNYNKPGRYMVSFIAANRYGCSDTANKLITVNDSPKVVAGPASYICLGSSVTLSATGGVSYQWDNNSSLSCLNCPTTIARPINQQVYRATATDINGCKASDTVLVKVKMPAKVSVGLGDTLCVGQSFALSASGTERYLWSPGVGLSSTSSPNPIASPQVTTRYKIVGYDTLGCFADSAFVDVVVYPIPKFDILEEKISGVSGSLVPLATTSSPDITRWHWSPPVGLNCTNCPKPVVTVGIPVTYTAVASNPGNCRTSDQVNVVPVCGANNVFIPNTFSPNGDGQNDVFFPHGKGLTLVKSMRIFSRWGELLFERRDFALNDPGAGWDGTYKGTNLTADVFVYMIEVLCDDNSTFNLKGNVTLLR